MTPHQLLTYEYVPDVLARRAPLRPDHLALIADWKADGRLILAGAQGDPPTGALFVFSQEADVEAFVAADPYAQNGLVVDRHVDVLNVV